MIWNAQKCVRTCLPNSHLILHYKNLVLLVNNNARDTNYFTKNFTNCWCGKWLLINKKMILMMSVDEN